MTIRLARAMFSSSPIYPQQPEPRSFAVNEQTIEDGFIQKLVDLKYPYRPDIRDWRENDFEVVHQLRINTDYSPSHPC